MMPPSADIENRAPVWEALSTLFLDTDTSILRRSRAEDLARSPYTASELEAILTEEVSPVCSWNLLSVAGEWAAFDQAWLCHAILRNASRPAWFARIGRKRILATPEWQATLALVNDMRRTGS